MSEKILQGILIAVIILGSGYLVYSFVVPTSDTPEIIEENTESTNNCGGKPEFSQFLGIGPEEMQFYRPSQQELDVFNALLEEWNNCVETLDWQTYRNEELGVQFNYPSAWGKLVEGEESCLLLGGSERAYLGEPCVHISISTSDSSGKLIFLAAQSSHFADYGPGRGAYFGDLFSLAKKGGVDEEEFVNTYCEINDTVRCSVGQNSNGILYAKSLELVQALRPQGDESRATYYFLHHPDSVFPGIILSTEGFEGTSFESTAEEVLDQIFSTFEFIE